MRRPPLQSLKLDQADLVHALTVSVDDVVADAQKAAADHGAHAFKEIPIVGPFMPAGLPARLRAHDGEVDEVGKLVRPGSMAQQIDVDVVKVSRLEDLVKHPRTGPDLAVDDEQTTRRLFQSAYRDVLAEQVVKGFLVQGVNR